MPLVAWRHITVSKQQGGLGLKDMVKFQQSLHMKCLWSIARDDNSLWVQVLKAKYLQRTDLWSCNRTTRCTSLWRAIIAVKPLLKDSVKWQLGNGRSCKAVGQPWHEIWMHYSPSNAAQRKLVVADLVAEDGDSWNTHKLIQLFGFHGALYIALNLPQVPKLSQRQDRLIFTAQHNGRFTIKSAYNLLVQKDQRMHNLTHLPADLYKLIWKTRDVLPRARIFLWRAIKEALPVDQVFSSRMSKTPTGCLLCGDLNETVVHVLFKCPLAQQLWRLSQFDLSTAGLPDNMVHLLSFLVKQLEDRQFPTIISIMWNWWKDRCKRVYEGKKVNPQQTLAAASYWTLTLEKASLLHTKYLSHNCHHEQHYQEHVHSSFTCWIDASWTHSGIGGTGAAYILLDKEGQLVHYQLNLMEATSPFHAELLSLKEAFVSVLQMGISQCVFFTDCLLLQSIISGTTEPEAADWMAFNDTMGFMADWIKQPQFYCIHVGREKNQLADNLSKYARTKGICYRGFTFPFFQYPCDVICNDSML
ncbi:RNA-directed DNA polymerase (reverse transcriptase)-related family protein [Rhynchospora pubera]|uniref:RNA-directed DNA polymerase (Reverse transcriptase)-related family protein n=1 Tax=Rhynchospora pubera TaxID=906938 RepID=A0AAV8CN68_9POAL|nr:RNA-directed DNA polymerase (reverse transcriptase)-related family protein [Rhynchospora pubera]